MGKDATKETAKLLEHDAWRPVHSSSLPSDPSLSPSYKKHKKHTDAITSKKNKTVKKDKIANNNKQLIIINSTTNNNNPTIPGPQLINRPRGEFEVGDIIDIPGDHHDLLGIFNFLNFIFTSFFYIVSFTVLFLSMRISVLEELHKLFFVILAG